MPSCGFSVALAVTSSSRRAEVTAYMGTNNYLGTGREGCGKRGGCRVMSASQQSKGCSLPRPHALHADADGGVATVLLVWLHADVDDGDLVSLLMVLVSDSHYAVRTGAVFLHAASRPLTISGFRAAAALQSHRSIDGLGCCSRLYSSYCAPC